MKKKWNIKKPDPTLLKGIKEKCDCNLITATVLANRLKTPEDAVRFLNPSLDQIKPPFTIKDMNKAITRIYSAIKNEEKILIFGDYDADGITSVTILLDFLKKTSVDVSYYIPHRTREGYGFKEDHVIKIAKPNLIDLIITVDCGISSKKAVKLAKEYGIDVIITDHHEVSSMPDAVAVINPKRPDCDAGFEYLSGVGVVFCLLICLRKKLRDSGFWQNETQPNLKEICDLVALGTVADIVPLINENRIFSKIGLFLMSNGCRSGIKALKEIARIKTENIDTSDLVYKLIPRINAAGRLEHASKAVELLSSTSIKNARTIAYNLDLINIKRRDLEQNIFIEARHIITSNPEILKRKSIVLSRKGWHEGVIGIVASKLTELYLKPVILISIMNNIGRGSARSIPGLDIHSCLISLKNYLEAFGGHAMAAGITIQGDNISNFYADFDKIVNDKLENIDYIPKMNIDYIIDFNNITNELINDLERMAPFGHSNKEPLFGTYNVKVRNSAIVGKIHRKMKLEQKNGKNIDAIQFNIDPSVNQPCSFERLAFKIQRNNWNGKNNVQLLIEDYC